MAKKTFISPKVYFAFKKIFGSDQSEDILISFLNAIVYNEESVISRCTIVNPYKPGQIETLKDSSLDVRAVLQSGDMVLIKIQMARVSASHKRVIYNTCKVYANQLSSAENYLMLSPAIAVTLTYFILFPKSPKVIHKFQFKDEEDSSEYPERELQLIFVELPRFEKELKNLNSLADKWIYFIKQASKLEEIPENLGEIAAIEKASKIAKLANTTVEEAEEISRRAMQLQDEIGRIQYAREEGRKEGIIDWYRALAMRLLKKRFGELTAEINSKVESLSLSDLEALIDAIFEFDSLEDLLDWLSEVESP
ncbi:MAG: Rpn family recombination-promoting nuclease/putative transposase [Hormoscilla sp. GUM202]|nr:Rpn family recombination-promoting nuclease/putative transposase [Hormoscilla sp. GUM202]